MLFINSVDALNVFFFTFGCKVNLYETENMKEAFETEGSFSITKSESSAQIFVINSCTVTANGDKKILRLVNRLRLEYPNAIITLSGCYPQAFPEEAESVLGADIITGTRDRKMIVKLVKDFMLERKKILLISNHTSADTFEQMQNTHFLDHTRAFIKIQDGCNQFCTYCIIPKARGRIRSKPLEDLRNEVTTLALSGHKEVVLVGINLSFYGAELGLRLVDAVELCCGIDGIERVRLGSIEPERLSDEDITRLSKLTKFCPHFHLSLQSGCDKTLLAMNRKYTSDDYLILVEKLRASFNNCAITTDIMVGFPDETDEDFLISMKFAQKIGFSKAHIFPYSVRSGTVAANMSGQVPSHIKAIRAKQMASATEQSAMNFLQKQVGLLVPVLFEKENSTQYHHGYAPNYTLVKIPRKKFEENDRKSLRNCILCVKIIKVEKDFCIGIRVSPAGLAVATVRDPD